MNSHRASDITNQIWHKITVSGLLGLLCLCIICLGPGLRQPLYGQGTIAETATTIELQEGINGGGTQPAAKPKPDANRPSDANRPRPVAVPPKPAPDVNAAAKPTTTYPPRPQAAAPVPAIEANSPDINDFNAFQRELNRMNLESKNEESLWLGRVEKKVELAKAIDELVVAELRFIRKLAVTDPNQTAKAIDLVLKQRQERLDKLITKLEEELKQERQQQADRREKRTVGRPSDNLPGQPAQSTMPRRTRVTVPE